MKSEIFEKKFKIVENFVKNSLKVASSCHDYDHTIRVFNNAKLILDSEKDADYQIVYIAAMLHDIGRMEEINNLGKVCHANIGSKIAEQFLTENDFDHDFVRKVSDAIARHRFRGEENAPVTLEDKIIFDADKIDSLGPVGIGRSFMFAAKVGAKLHNSKNIALNASEYSSEDTAYREYLVKLSKIPSRMQTYSGKIIANRYAKMMDEFFKEMNIQVEGIKL